MLLGRQWHSLPIGPEFPLAGGVRSARGAVVTMASGADAASLVFLVGQLPIM